jgi:ribosomal-protein-alanine acetyltransferase
MAANDVNIRSATSDDISFMLALERECPTAAHWTEQQYRRVFTNREDLGRENNAQPLVLVAEEVANTEAHQNPHLWQNRPEVGYPRLLGFLVAHRIAAEWELENIAVAESARRKGLGKRLLVVLLDRAVQAGSESMFLEVRESNTAARNLYESADFQQIGRRKSYYINPLEDAIVYRHSLK